MITDPPILRIRRNFERPAPKIVAALRGAALEAKVKAGLRLPDFAVTLLKSGRIEEMERA